MQSRAALDRCPRQDLADRARVQYVAAVGKLQTRNGLTAGGTRDGAQQLRSHRGGGYAELGHLVRLGARAPAGWRSEPELVVAVATQEPRSAGLAQQPLPRCARRSHQRREISRVGATTERRGGETPGPQGNFREPVPRNIKRPPQREQLPPEAEQECRRGQRLDQLRRNVSHVAKARAADARLLGVGEQHAPPLSRARAKAIAQPMMPAPITATLSCSPMRRAYTIYDPTRSEERRVGKECRSRWSPY